MTNKSIKSSESTSFAFTDSSFITKPTQNIFMGTYTPGVVLGTENTAADTALTKQPF